VQVESNPQLVQIVPPNEVVVLIGFELSIGELRGMMNLCIPYNSIERIGGKLSANSWSAYGRRQATPESIRQIRSTVCTSLVDLRVRLAETRITTGELISLRVGDIITTEKDMHSPLIVSVEGIPKFRARPGALKGHKAVLIDSAIDNPADALGG
jgi:flagellar motor switch protein FliM